FVFLSRVFSKTNSFLDHRERVLKISLSERSLARTTQIKKNKNTKGSDRKSSSKIVVKNQKRNVLRIQGPMPVYPRPAKIRGIEGDVTLKIYIDQKGLPYLIEVADSSGYSILDKAAVEGVKKWSFSPIHSGDVKVASWIKKRFSFRLN
ncbi:MAG: energy transducer TonB, partial [Halobacteriovoraceae bacterium]|nr:energy transducer TonB [Halobacteriovoraceae bacterium]